MKDNRKVLVPLAVLVAILALQSSALLPTAFSTPSVWYVASTPTGTGYSGGSCSAPGFNTISDAIAAASPGDTVNVCTGTYVEQVTISKSLTLTGVRFPTSSSLPTIQPTTLPASITPSYPSSCTTSTPALCDLQYAILPQAAIILVSGATDVTIRNVVVDGSAATSFVATSCNPPTTGEFMGILFSGASGTVRETTVKNIAYLPGNYPNDGNCGEGIWVQSPTGPSSAVSILDNTVTNYNKNGITCNDLGTKCTIVGNSISPLAAAQPYVASNGILIGDGAVGMVSNNTVMGNECSEGGSPPACGSNLYNGEAQATGILTYYSGAGTAITRNRLKENDIGIESTHDAVTVTRNNVMNNRYVGIYQNDGTYTASNNQISGSPIGVAVVSDGLVTTTTSTLTGNDFDGPFSTALVQVTTFTGISPYGGPNPGMATLTLNGKSETVSGGTYDGGTCTPAATCLPTIVNVTKLPS